MSRLISRTRTAGAWFVVVAGLLLSVPASAQDRSRYRDFRLGGDLPSVSALAKVAASNVKTIHLRPAVIQELEWRPSYFVSGSTDPQNDPVQQIVFSFYNDQLSSMVVDYDHDRTAGMTVDDMVAALSTTYGSPLPVAVKKARTVPSSIDDESGTPVARWGDAEYSVVLYRSADLYSTSSASRFRIIVASPRLDALSRTAGAQAIQMDEREAPQREAARQKKQAEDTRASREKARLANKAAFRP
jgi:hypothetical protein